MSFYTVKYIKRLLEDLPDDEPIAGILCLRDEFRDDNDETISPDNWVKVVDWFDRIMEPDGFNVVREAVTEAIGEVVE